MHPGETVAGALRRLSGKGQRAKAVASASASGGKRKRTGEEAERGEVDGGADASAARKQQFDTLTDAADTLLRAGHFDIFSQSREHLQEQLASHPGAPRGASSEEGGHTEAAAAEAASMGIDEQTHAGALAGGFVLDKSRCVYYNASSGLFFDPKTMLYWPATGGDTYYYWDAGAGQFVPATQHAGSEPRASRLS